MGSKIGSTGYRYISTLGVIRRGFLVRIPCPLQPGQFRNKEFSGNSIPLRELLRRARKWRDETYSALYGHKIPGRTLHRQQANNTTTAIPGVRRQTKTTVKRIGDREYAYKITTYIAEVWLEPGLDGKRSRKSRSKVFSVRKYGEDMARDMAIGWREEMAQRLSQDGPEKFEKWWQTMKAVRATGRSNGT